ncbi:UvrD-helicase domain-containing protein [Candidatus Dojkabacteria bacterium]|nr:UvrD-helicase domain-containing protein [Candidatus Dojkabacteria bacterium]
MAKTSKIQTNTSKTQLNPAQKKAVQHDKGPLLIIAGAGTGKTHVITQRIVSLVERELAKPEEILALTFTQKAAQEMTERVDIAMPYGYTETHISTFHSFCDQVLRQEAIYIGLDPGYTLMSNSQEYVFFRERLFDLPLKRFRPHGNPTKFINEILKHFSRLQDENIGPEAYRKYLASAKAKKLSKDERADYSELANVYEKYSEMKVQESRMGFSDLVPTVLRLFHGKPEVLKRYREKFKYYLVDEYQDTNFVQNELVKLLAGKNGNITVVGDDDQSIYKFRGAAISNILDFKRFYPDYKKVVLTENYRSRQQILDKSYSLISQNNPYRLEVTEKIDKKLKGIDYGTKSEVHRSKTSSDSQMELKVEDLDKKTPLVDDAVRRIHTRSDVEEAESVVKEIKSLISGKKPKYKLSDIAILVRANDHSENFITSLKYHGIQFTFTGPKGLYSRPEIKDMIALLRLSVDYKDDISMYRVLTLPMSDISAREYVDLQRLARKKRISVFELVEELLGIKVGEKKGKSGKSASISRLAQKLLDKKSIDWLKDLMNSLDAAFSMVRELRPVGEILYELVTRIGYLEYFLKEESTMNEWKISNISKYFELLKKFSNESDSATVHEYLDYLEYSLEIGENPQADPLDVENPEAVNISTIHGAKGLEFPVVFMVNLVSDRFPTRRRSEVLPIPEDLIQETLPEGDEHVQEERRLFYVGMTRAMDRLYLTSADYYGDGIRKKKQSIFLHDLDLVVESKGEPSKSLSDRTSIVSEKPIVEIPPDIRKTAISHIERNLSYSHISSYTNCPYQFYFRYILNVPGAESAARSFGMTIHNTLREFYDRLSRFKGGLPGVSSEPTLEDLLKIYDEKWQSSGYESQKQEDRRYESGKQSLEKFYQKCYRKKDLPIALEKRFRVSLGNFWVTGVIDRMDKTDEGIEIIDYKTGKTPSDIKALKKDLQPAIYVLAAEALYKEPVVGASLLYVEGQKKIDILVDDNLKEKAVKEIKATLEDIRSLKFEPNPGRLCKFCDYRNICDYALV